MAINPLSRSLRRLLNNDHAEALRVRNYTRIENRAQEQEQASIAIRREKALNAKQRSNK